MNPSGPIFSFGIQFNFFVSVFLSISLLWLSVSSVNFRRWCFSRNGPFHLGYQIRRHKIVCSIPSLLFDVHGLCNDVPSFILFYSFWGGREVIEFFYFWRRCQGLNQGPHAYWACALPLSYTLLPPFISDSNLCLLSLFFFLSVG